MRYVWLHRRNGVDRGRELDIVYRDYLPSDRTSNTQPLEPKLLVWNARRDLISGRPLNTPYPLSHAVKRRQSQTDFTIL